MIIAQEVQAKLFISVPTFPISHASSQRPALRNEKRWTEVVTVFWEEQ